MNNIMIDIETMGISANAPIVAIAAVFFEPYTGEIGETFYQHISLGSSVRSGAQIDPDTVLWWMKQSDNARSEITSQRLEMVERDALVHLRDFIAMSDTEFFSIWSKGPSFDLTILKSAYARHGSTVPWDYTKEMDVRTAISIGFSLGVTHRELVPDAKHHALKDAVYQAECVCDVYQKIASIRYGS